VSGIDKRTGRPFGDHGTANQAIAFAIDGMNGWCSEPEVFLKAWREGDLTEWPEFYIWLGMQEENNGTR